MKHRLSFLFVCFVLALAPGVAKAATCTFTPVDTIRTLDADCTTDVTILIPNGFTLDGAGNTITAVDPSGGHFLGAVVKNAGLTAHVKNLTITTSGLANVCDGSGSPDNRLRGILFDGAGGSILDNTISDINQGSGSGCQEGNAIEVRNAPFDGTHPGTKTVTISGNTVTDYQKTGIVVNGDVAATITDNTVTGFGPVGAIAQNGIQFGFGATGILMKNTVAGSWFTGADWIASGVLVFESNDVMIHQNQISGSQVGVAIESWCYFAPTASENRVVRNTIDGADYGVSVHTFTFYSSCNPAVDNNKVVNNKITSSNGDTGVSVGVFDLDIPGDGYDPVAFNNKVIRNIISGYIDDVDDSGLLTKKHANVFTPAAP